MIARSFRTLRPRFMALPIAALAIGCALAPTMTDRVAAQDNGAITLDDNTPSADITVQPINGAPGVLYADLQNVQATIVDSSGTQLFALLDHRITGMDLKLTGSSSVHVHLERLPGFTTALAQVTGEPALPAVNAPTTTQPVTQITQPESGTIAVGYSQSVPVTTTDAVDELSMQFARPIQGLTLFDEQGVVLLTMQNASAIGGLALRIAPGQYTLNLANSDANNPDKVAVGLSAGTASTLNGSVALNVAATTSAATAIPPTVAAVQPTATTAVACLSTVRVSSTYIRNGPGLQYAAFAYARQGAVIPIVAMDTTHAWLMLQTSGQTGWLSAANVTLGAGCNALPVSSANGQSSLTPNTSNVQTS